MILPDGTALAKQSAAVSGDSQIVSVRRLSFMSKFRNQKVTTLPVWILKGSKPKPFSLEIGMMTSVFLSPWTEVYANSVILHFSVDLY